MSLDTWIAYTLACVVLTVIPGPSVMLVIAQSLTRGRSAVALCILGDVIGSVVLVGLSFAGVGAILASSAILFQIVKWAGVVYLAWLGLSQIAAARVNPPEGPGEAAVSAWGSFWAGAVTAVLNPKAIVFYMAFLAQFIDPEGDMPLQLAVLTLTSSLVVVVVLAAYALVAERAGSFCRSPRARRRIGYAGGGFMIGGSAVMAVTR